MKPKYEQVPLIKSLYNIKKEFFTTSMSVAYPPRIRAGVHPHGQRHQARRKPFRRHRRHGNPAAGAEPAHNWLVNKRSAPVGTDTDYQVVIHFRKAFSARGFFELAPFAEINELLKKSELGLCFKDGETARIGKEMEAMLHMKEFDRSMALLELLQRLSAKEHTVLSSYGFNNVLNEEKVKRMNKGLQIHHHQLQGEHLAGGHRRNRQHDAAGFLQIFQGAHAQDVHRIRQRSAYRARLQTAFRRQLQHSPDLLRIGVQQPFEFQQTVQEGHQHVPRSSTGKKVLSDSQKNQ